MKSDVRRGLFFRVAVIVLAVFGVATILTVAQAGSLFPVASPASSLRTIGEVHDAISSSSFNSSGYTAKSNGSAIEIAKCVITKMQGGSC